MYYWQTYTATQASGSINKSNYRVFNGQDLVIVQEDEPIVLKDFFGFLKNISPEEKEVFLASIDDSTIIFQEDIPLLEDIEPVPDFLLENINKSLVLSPSEGREYDIQPHAGLLSSEVKDFSIGALLDYAAFLENGTLSSPEKLDSSSFFSFLDGSSADPVVSQGRLFSTDGMEVNLDNFSPEISLGAQDQLVERYDAVCSDPVVTVLSDGSYVITWKAADQLFSQVHDSSGNKSGNIFTLPGDYVQKYTAIEALPTGGFVFAYSNGHNIYLQYYLSDGSIDGYPVFVTSAVGNPYFNPEREVYEPTISFWEDGSYIVLWREAKGGWGQRYDADGNKVGEVVEYSYTHDVRIVTLENGYFFFWGNNHDGLYSSFNLYNDKDEEIYRGMYTRSDSNSDGPVSGIPGGGVAYLSHCVIDATGLDIVRLVFVGPEGGDDYYVIEPNFLPSVPDTDMIFISGDEFLLVYQGSDGNIYVRSCVTGLDGKFSLNTFGDPVLINSGDGPHFNPVISAGSDGNFIISWTDSSGNVYSQFIDSGGNPLDSSAPESWYEGDGSVPLVGEGQFQLQDDDSTLTQMVVTVTNYVAGDTLNVGLSPLPNGLSVSIEVVDGQLVLTISGAASHADYLSVLESIEYSFTGDRADFPVENREVSIVVTDPSGDDSNIVTTEIEVIQNDVPSLELGSQDQVVNNDDIASSGSIVTFLSDGTYIVSWKGSDGQLYGQRHDTDGSKNGVVFTLRDDMVQKYTSIDSLPDGGFIMSFSDGLDCYVQRYFSDGSADGDAINITNDSFFNQKEPSISVWEDGSYVVAWNRDVDDMAYYPPIDGVEIQRYDSSGNEVGDRIFIRTIHHIHHSNSPRVIALDDGSFAYWAYDTKTGSWWDGPRDNWVIFDSDNNEIYRHSSTLDDRGVFVKVPDYGLAYLYQESSGGITRLITQDGESGTMYSLEPLNFIPDLSHADIAFSSSDHFVLVYRGEDGNLYTQSCTRGWNDQFRIEDMTGSVMINSGEGPHFHPSIAFGPDGNFIISWTDSAGNVYSQTVDSAGNPLDSSAPETWFYGEDSVPVVGEGQLQIEDDDMVTSEMVVTITNYVAGDTLSVGLSPLPNGLSVSIEVVDGQLVLTISGEALRSDYMSVLESILYDFVGDRASLPGENREISIVITDPSGEVSNIVTTEIEVMDRTDNTAPFITLDPQDQLVVESSSSIKRPDIVFLLDENGDPTGAYVITAYYHTSGQLYMQFYHADGTQNGAAITYKNYGIHPQTPSIYLEALLDGSFVITFRTSSQSACAQVFDSQGAPIGDTITIDSWSVMPVIALDDGGFMLVWEEGGTLVAQKYTADGTADGDEIALGKDDVRSTQDVISLANGDFVVVYSGSTTELTQRYDANGIPQGSEHTGYNIKNIVSFGSGNDYAFIGTVNGSSVSNLELNIIIGSSSSKIDLGVMNDQYGSSFSLASDGTDFVVVYQSSGGMYALPVSGDGIVGTPVLVSSAAGNSDVSIAYDSQSGEYIVTWGRGNNFYFQTIDSDGNPLDSSVSEVWIYGGDAVSIFGEEQLSLGDADGDAIVKAVIAIEGYVSGDVIGYDITSAPGGWAITESPAGTWTITAPAGATDVHWKTFLSSLTYDFTGDKADANAIRTISIYVEDARGAKSATVTTELELSDGNTDPFVTIKDHQDQVVGKNLISSGNDIIFFLDDNGDPTGGYLISWRGYESGNYKIYMQAYNADGTQNGTAFTYDLPSNFTWGNVEALSGGAYIVSWTSGSGTGGNSYAQLFDNNGNPDGAVIEVDNTDPQRHTHVVALDNGGFMLMWEEGDTLVAQKYTADGTADGVEIDLGNARGIDSVTSLANGDFVVAYYVGALGVRATQRYDADGIPQGPEYTAYTRYSIQDVISFGAGYAVIGRANVYGGFKLTIVEEDGSFSTILESSSGTRDSKFSLASDGTDFLVVYSDYWSLTAFSVSATGQRGGSVKISRVGHDHSVIYDEESGNYIVTWGRSPNMYFQTIDSSGNPLESSTPETWIYGEGSVSLFGEGQLSLGDADGDALTAVITIEGDNNVLISSEQGWVLTESPSGTWTITAPAGAKISDWYAFLTTTLQYDFTGDKADATGSRTISIYFKDEYGGFSATVSTELELSDGDRVPFDTFDNAFRIDELDGYVVEDSVAADIQYLFADEAKSDHFTFNDEDSGMIFYISDFDPHQDVIDLSSVFDAWGAEASLDFSQGENGHSVIEVSEGTSIITIHLNDFVDASLLQASIIGTQGDDTVM